MKFFVKDLCETVRARVVTYGMQVDNDVLYHGIVNQPSPRVVIFGMQVDNDVLYHGIVNQPSPSNSSLYLSNFLSFNTLNDEIFHQRFL